MMIIKSIYKGKQQNWASSFDISDAKSSNYDLLTRGIIKIGQLETAVDLEDLPWAFNDDSHPSWRLRFLSLKWICPLVYESVSDQSKITSRLPIIKQVLRSWIDWESTAENEDRQDHWHGHTSALRTTALVSASSVIDEPWLLDAIVSHGKWLADEAHWDGPWNHGLMQSMALLSVAFRLDEESMRQIAMTRIEQCLNAMIDDQGCINEQAPAYSRFIYNLLTQLAKIFVTNDMSPGSLQIAKRQALLIRYMVQSTDPSGNFAQIGDSLRTAPMTVSGTDLEYVASLGEQGTAPTELISIFDQGFIFGRSGWGTNRPFRDESFYSLRFGPQRIIHGHNDHMSLTMYDCGRDIIIDSGHNGYRNDAYRQHLRSIDAHNVLRVRDVRHDWSAYTDLIRSEVSDSSQFFELRDQAYKGFVRSRSMLAGPHAPMVVLDRVGKTEKAATFDQLWHLSREHVLESVDEGHAVFRTLDGAISTHLISYIVDPDMGTYKPSPSYWKGSLNPHQGWSSGSDLENVPSPVLAFSATTRNLFQITVIVNLTCNDEVGHSLRAESDGLSILRIHMPHGSWAWKISHGGYIGLRSKPSILT